jgi:hypothetical protein
MSENEMTCAQLSGVAAELALGVLTGRERAMAVAHLDTCDACREEVRQLMVTGEQLRELLPAAEPPAGFETRVLGRLGLAAPAGNGGAARGHAELLRTARRDRRTAPRRQDRDATRPGGPGASGPSASGPGGSARPGAGSARPARPGGTARLRRALGATVLGLALFAAGFGGWRIGAGSPSPATSAGPLTSTTLLSATHRNVGRVFLYSGTSRWMYMSVDLGSGDETVTCQVIGTDGRLTTIGSFQLTGGYGGWGSPDPGNAGTVHGARLVGSDGTVLATASFNGW